MKRNIQQTHNRINENEDSGVVAKSSDSKFSLLKACSPFSILCQRLKNLERFGQTEYLFWIILSFLIFSFRYDAFSTFIFDEIHYIPSALEWLSGKVILNYEHPPLGKLLIALGLAVFGNESLGWRFSSLIAGSLLVGAMFKLGELLGDHSRSKGWKPIVLARLCAFISITNFVLFVQSRTAMLDIFMMLFLAVSWLYGIKIYLQTRRSKKNWILFGMFGGLSASCKWTGGIWFVVFTVVLIALTFRREKRKFLQPKIMSMFFASALFAYLVPFMAYLFVETSHPISITDLLWNFQFEMFELQKRVVGTHPYSSSWYTWIFSFRPIWYAFESITENAESCKGVFFVANPVVTIGSALSYLYLLYRSIRCRESIEIFLVILITAFTVQWALIPRNLTFYYYYFPNVMFLTFIMSYVVFIKGSRILLWVTNTFSLLTFFYFYPVLASMTIAVKDLSWWVWFHSWL